MWSETSFRCRAPGRINLIGEHTDYNGGWVMPAAISLEVSVAADRRSDRGIRLYSRHFEQAAEFSLDDRAVAAPVPIWSRSLRGVALLLDRLRPLPGADLLLESTIPVGAGLSSSAAAEVAVGCALAHLAGTEVPPTALAQLCQQASHEFAGSRCGIMDQYIACHGRRDAFLELDTQTLEERWLPWPVQASLVACDTGVRHDNASGEYNQRRAECEAAAQLLGLDSLRELTEAALPQAQSRLPPLLFARCRHVVTENARVHAAAAALAAGDLAQLGQLLDASHASLRDDYQVSCPELDQMAALCRRHPGVWGARMMGGGFGGCVLALTGAGPRTAAPYDPLDTRPGRGPLDPQPGLRVLTTPEVASTLAGAVGPAYREATGRQPAFWECRSADGVGPLPSRHD